MSNFRNKLSFEKAFKKHVYNFDETKIWFEYTKRGMRELNVCFIWNNKLNKFPMYKSQFEIDTWGNHFIDFLNTGEFDYNGYWKLYGGKNPNIDIFVDDKIHKFSLCNKLGNQFYEHSPEMDKFMSSPEGKTIGKKHGIKLVPKPL